MEIEGKSKIVELSLEQEWGNIPVKANVLVITKGEVTHPPISCTGITRTGSWGKFPQLGHRPLWKSNRSFKSFPVCPKLNDCTVSVPLASPAYGQAMSAEKAQGTHGEASLCFEPAISGFPGQLTHRGSDPNHSIQHPLQVLTRQ